MHKKNSVGRPREFDENDALEKLMNLFWEKGYEGTSLSDMMSVTCLKKGSLYAAFGDKHAMYLKAIQHYETFVIDSACHSLKFGGTPKDRLEVFLSAPIDAAFTQGDTRGCFLCNASADRAALDEKSQALVCRGYNKLERALTDVIKEIKPRWAEDKIIAKAQLLLTVYSGLRIMARSIKKKTPLDHAKDTALEF